MTKYYEESKAGCLMERVGEAWEGGQVRSSTAGKVRRREVRDSTDLNSERVVQMGRNTQL